MINYKIIKDGIYIFQKEELYRVLFQDVYLLVNDDLYDNDSIRKITTGNNTIHRKAIKAVYTDNGFEILRRNIKCECIPIKTVVLEAWYSLCLYLCRLFN